jgi:hypothetical protein
VALWVPEVLLALVVHLVVTILRRPPRLISQQTRGTHSIVPLAVFTEFRTTVLKSRVACILVNFPFFSISPASPHYNFQIGDLITSLRALLRTLEVAEVGFSDPTPDVSNLLYGTIKPQKSSMHSLCSR